MGSANTSKMGFDTMAIHGGAGVCPTTGATSPAIYQSAAYVFKNAQNAANIFSLKEKGYLYARITNPTVAALEEKLALLEGGTGATCTPSGLAAQMLLFTSLMNSGDDFVASRKIYGGTSGQFDVTFRRAFGWNCIFADPTDPENFKRAITPKTKLIFVESLSNPENFIPDMAAIAKIADEAGIPLIVDNTIATPYLCRPVEFGAAAVVHSTTKYLSGQGHAMGGAVVDCGTFDWKKHADRFPTLAKPDASFNGMVFADAFEENPLAMHNHGVGLRDLGANQQPMNAYLTLLGIETLGVRMDRHCANALKVATFLKSHKQVAWVNYSGLPDSPSYKFGQKYMRGGMCSGLFTFGLKGGYEAGVKLVESVKLFQHLANIGDTRSLIIHPSSTTHRWLPEDQKKAAGVGSDVVRISVGLENAEDLMADLDQGMSIASAKAA